MLPYASSASSPEYPFETSSCAACLAKSRETHSTSLVIGFYKSGLWALPTTMPSRSSTASTAHEKNRCQPKNTLSTTTALAEQPGSSPLVFAALAGHRGRVQVHPEALPATPLSESTRFAHCMAWSKSREPRKFSEGNYLPNSRLTGEMLQRLA